MIEKAKKIYLEAILDTNRKQALEIIDASIQEGHSPETIIFKILIPVMEELGAIVRLGTDATLAQLYIAARISSQITERLIPQFSKKIEVSGTVVLGSAKGDFHGLGKKIIGGCLRTRMIEVVDLGLNVPPEKFIEEAVKHNAQVIGVSSMMLHTARGQDGPIKVREILQKEGLQNRIRLLVGGAPYRFHPTLYKEVGADAWSDNGLTATSIIEGLIKEVRMS